MGCPRLGIFLKYFAWAGVFHALRIKLQGMKFISSAAVLMLCTALLQAGSMDGAHGQSIRADALYEQYEANPIAADAKYRGKRLSVGGKVGRLGVDSDVGIPYVILVGSNLSTGIKCVFPRDAMAKLSTLKPGSMVAISGVVEGKRHEFSDQITLQDCRM
jgi:hypothetical protein